MTTLTHVKITENYIEVNASFEDGQFVTIETTEIGPRPKSLAAAWKKSFEKWSLLRQALDHATDGDLVSVITGSVTTCGLCNLYNDTSLYYDSEEVDDRECYGCPIFDYTGYRFCHGTPHEVIEHLQLSDPVVVWKRAVDAEIEFLELVKRSSKT